MDAKRDMLTPAAAVAALLERLAPVADEVVDWREASGRVLAEAVHADRASPPHDVSAMDGYAVRLSELERRELPVAGEVVTGAAPPTMPEGGAALRIFTGGCVPAGAEAVIRREDVDETPQRIRLNVAAETIRPGQNIRRQGENLAAGEAVVASGEVVQPAVMAALASFGHVRPRVYRRVRVGVLVTGDELLAPEQSPQPWQIRDSNGPTLAAMFAGVPWVDWQGVVHARDTLAELTEALRGQLAACDAVLLTGGVSMGDHDHVPAAVRSVDGEVVFHKLPIRPGKPLLAAVGSAGQAIVGLPGNPLSVMVTARRFALAALRRRGGFGRAVPPAPMVRLVNEDQRTLPLWWYRTVRLVGSGETGERREANEPNESAGPGVAQLVAGKGSGDVVSAARSDGFVEVPAGRAGTGPWPYWPWQVD